MAVEPEDNQVAAIVSMFLPPWWFGFLKKLQQEGVSVHQRSGHDLSITAAVATGIRILDPESNFLREALKACRSMYV